MPTTHNLYTLSSTVPAKLTPDGVHSGMDITLQNVNTTGYIYVGGEGVSVTDYGYRINPSNSVSWELPGTDGLYAIAETTGLKLAVLKTSLETGS